MPDLLGQSDRHLAQPDHLVVQSILVFHACFEQAEPDAKRSQLLADVVMEVAGDLCPFGFLSQHQPVCQ